MNYAQITINGEAVGMRFGMLATQLFYDAAENGKRLMVGGNITDVGIAYVLYCGYVNHCEVKMIDPVLTFDVFYDRVDGAGEGDSEIGVALDCWAKSRVVQKAVEASQDAKKKKSKA